jgi:two-component system OmpR family sensor kinase
MLTLWLVVFLGAIAFAVYLVITSVRRFVRGFRAGLRGTDGGPERPSLRRVLFTTVLVTLLALFLIITIVYEHNDQQQAFQGSQGMYQLQNALGNAIVVGPQAMDAMEAALRQSMNGNPSGSGDLSLAERGSIAGTGLPARAISSLRSRGWAIGTAQMEGELQHYVTWRTSKSDAVFYFWVPTPWYVAWFQYPWTLLFGIAILSPFAAAAAWVLNRRIVKPVRQVSEASVVLADGGRPMEIPTKSPYELSVLADSFNRMADKLRRAQDSEREFLLSVGHELKTPLTSIDGYAELLADGAVDAKQAAEVLGQESARLRRLIGDLLDLARIDRSEFSVIDEPVDLVVTAADVAERYAALAKTLGVKLEVQTCGRASAQADHGRLLQVASNLVENALRATPTGGVVRVTVESGLMEVSDSGPGLTEEDIEHAFERFYLHRKYSGPDVGTGLGLAIVKELVCAMGGSLGVTSARGSGSTFQVQLRTANAVLAPASAAS